MEADEGRGRGRAEGGARGGLREAPEGRGPPTLGGGEARLPVDVLASVLQARLESARVPRAQPWFPSAPQAPV